MEVAEITVSVVNSLKDTEGRDIDFLIGQLADCARDGDGHEAIRSFRRQMIVAAAEMAQEKSAEITQALREFATDYREQERIIGELTEALRPFAWYFDVNDCKDRQDHSDAIEVPIRDLRAAFEMFMALGLAVTPVALPPAHPHPAEDTGGVHRTRESANAPIGHHKTEDDAT